MSFQPRRCKEANPPRCFGGLAALAALLLLTYGCAPSQPRADVVIINGANPQTLDPALATGIEDLRIVAAIVRGRHVAQGVRAMVVPGSGSVRRQAEAEGIAAILRDAGFEWREPGCSMCLAMNDDFLAVGERCASTTNRNFEGRQGRGGRTHLMSPAMAAAAALTGRITDVRTLETQSC